MKWSFLLMLFLTSWSSGCYHEADYLSIKTQLDTTLFTAPRSIGVVSDPALAEASGLAPSLQNPGYIWVEEDSGNPNQIQLLTPEGVIAGRYILPTLTNHDWEDIATGESPIAGRSYVYLAEIGDNAAGVTNRIIYRLFGWSANKKIYRFIEPSLVGRNLPVTETITVVDTITLTLPDGPKDAEAILVDPVTNDFYILSKGKESEIYLAPYPQSLTRPVAMKHVLTLPFKYVTSAAMSPDGSEILIRTYKQLFYYKRQPGESVVAALQRPPRQIPLAPELQGEAISWRFDGSGYYSTTESRSTDPKIIYFYQRLRASNESPHSAQ